MGLRATMCFVNFVFGCEGRWCCINDGVSPEGSAWLGCRSGEELILDPRLHHLTPWEDRRHYHNQYHCYHDYHHYHYLCTSSFCARQSSHSQDGVSPPRLRPLSYPTLSLSLSLRFSGHYIVNYLIVDSRIGMNYNDDTKTWTNFKQ